MEPHFIVIKETMIVDEVEKIIKVKRNVLIILTKRNTSYHQKWNHTEAKQNENKGLQNKPTKKYEDKCYRCGMKRHWSHTCRTHKHLVDLYQASIKDKEKYD
jgi:hypothetical protein